MLYLEIIREDSRRLDCINGEFGWTFRNEKTEKDYFSFKEKDVFLHIELCHGKQTTEYYFSKEDDLKSVNIMNEQGIYIHEIFNKKTEK